VYSPSTFICSLRTVFGSSSRFPLVIALFVPRLPASRDCLSWKVRLLDSP
jgi:hypothetical protein